MGNINFNFFNRKSSTQLTYRTLYTNHISYQQYINSQLSLQQQQQLQTFPDNTIKTTSSNILTFIPLNLFYQFKNLSNVYFLFISFLQINPYTTLTNGRPIMLIVLSILMTIIMIKSAYQQIIRYLKDTQQNNSQVAILKQQKFQNQKCKNIQVGSIIKIKQDCIIPADIVLLSSSSYNSSCFIETKSLDGQTSLKIKQSVHSKISIQKLSPKQLYQKHFKIKCQKPNQFLDQFQGTILIEKQQISLQLINFIPRGAYLRNTDQIIGVVIYTGEDTKIRMNSVKFTAKMSKLMYNVNGMIISIFGWQCVICLVLTAYNILEDYTYKQFISYISEQTFFLFFIHWWLNISYLVPISLMVTIQMIKFFQALVLNRDKRGYVSQYNCKIVSNNSTINENLGQIRYIFTDKTGTLTKNEMNFKKIVLNGNIYGQRYDFTQSLELPNISNVDFKDICFLQKVVDIKNNNKNIATDKQNQFQNSGLSFQQYQEILRVMYLCHDIYVSTNKQGEMTYNSGSPDEIALINFAKYCGRQLLSIDNNVLKIYNRKTDKIMKFQRLALLQFNSDRKRMSVIVKNQKNQIQMFTKGADSILFKLIQQNDFNKIGTQKALDKFSCQGLRTLLLAKKKISQSSYKQWEQKFKKANLSLDNRKQKILKIYDQIEKDLQIVGGTAVQDALQDMVPQTIEAMTSAGMHFFVLTGDKKQTAISIGKSSRLISKTTHILQIPDYQQEKATQWYQWLKKAKEDRIDKVYLLNGSKPLPPEVPLHKTIVYRCTPSQKQKVVKLVQNQTQQLTLAVGDGANDVNMIVTADVGIGVRGKQGSQAIRVSDIAIGKFSLLSYLTLYFGRECYIKNCNVVKFSFFKSWCRVTALIIYGTLSYFSQILLFDYTLQILFEIFFATIPIFIYGTFNQKYSLSQSLRFPTLYLYGLYNKGFNRGIYNTTIGLGVFYGICMLYTSMIVCQTNVLSSDGKIGYIYQSGSIVFSLLVQIVNLRILVMGTGFSPLLALIVFGSILCYWLTYFIYSETFQSQINNSFVQQLTTPNIILIHVILLSFFIFGQFALQKLKQFNEKVFKFKVAQQAVNNMIGRIFLGQSFKQNFKSINYLGSSLGFSYSSKIFDQSFDSPFKKFKFIQDIPIFLQNKTTLRQNDQIMPQLSLQMIKKSSFEKANFNRQNQILMTLLQPNKESINITNQEKSLNFNDKKMKKQF